MPNKKTLIASLGAVTLLTAVIAAHSVADKAQAASDATMPFAQYESACGGCHMAYPPELLPAASWRKIVPDSGEHFGDTLTLDAAQLKSVQAYLEGNAADRATSKLARKIADSLDGASPERISDVPYIVRKHRKIAPDVLNRPAVGGLGNCISCHPGAARSDFDDDDVKIPQ